MAITKAQAKQLRTLMTRRVTAALAYSWNGEPVKGTSEELRKKLVHAEQNLDTFIKELTEK